MTPESVVPRHQTRNGVEFAVAELEAAEFGRKEIRLAEHEMPGLMALRREYAEVYPLRGARVFSTQDHAAAAVVVGPPGTPEAPQGVPVFAWKGEGRCGAATR